MSYLEILWVDRTINKRQKELSNSPTLHKVQFCCIAFVSTLWASASDFIHWYLWFVLLYSGITISILQSLNTFVSILIGWIAGKKLTKAAVGQLHQPLARQLDLCCTCYEYPNIHWRHMWALQWKLCLPRRKQVDYIIFVNLEHHQILIWEQLLFDQWLLRDHFGLLQSRKLYIGCMRNKCCHHQRHLWTVLGRLDVY